MGKVQIFDVKINFVFWGLKKAHLNTELIEPQILKKDSSPLNV